MSEQDFYKPDGDGWSRVPTSQERIRRFMAFAMEEIELTPEQAEWFDKRREEMLKNGPKIPSRRVPIGDAKVTKPE